MTDNTQEHMNNSSQSTPYAQGSAQAELDVIFDKMGYTKNTDFRKEAIRLITDWHNKQVEEVLDRAKQRFHEPIEHDGSYISISVIDKTFDELIQAERALIEKRMM